MVVNNIVQNQPTTTLSEDIHELLTISSQDIHRVFHNSGQRAKKLKLGHDSNPLLKDKLTPYGQSVCNAWSDGWHGRKFNPDCLPAVITPTEETNAS